MGVHVHEMHKVRDQVHPNLCHVNLIAGSWPPFITGLLYDDPTPSSSRQIAYKIFGC